MERFDCLSLAASKHVILSGALQRLKEEHIPLCKLKQDMFQMTHDIYRIQTNEQLPVFVRKLRGKVIVFYEQLELHSAREEDVLFPMMAVYIGSEFGPIAVMEQEHAMAKHHIQSFLSSTAKIDENISLDAVRTLVYHITQAYHILTDHFMKEELVLFPMAERTLSQEDQDKLEAVLYGSKQKG